MHRRRGVGENAQRPEAEWAEEHAPDDAASDRAVAMAYGPRQLVILQARADIFAGPGDAAEARRTLERALALAESFPPGQRSESSIASLRKRLAAM